MSPEQVRGRPADARSDVFSFGAILYEMLTGQRAFHGDSAASTMSAILMREPAELSTTNRKIHPGLERIVHHCLEKNPEARFHSSHDLAFDLEALTGVSAPATTAGFYAPARNWKKPLAGAGLVVAGLAAGLLLHRLLPRRDPPTYERMSFRLGGAFAARFAPDGRTVVYSASQNGAPYRVSSRSAGGESVDLGLPNGDLLAVSSLGEMAIAIGRREAGKGAGHPRARAAGRRRAPRHPRGRPPGRLVLRRLRARRRPQRAGQVPDRVPRRTDSVRDDRRHSPHAPFPRRRLRLRRAGRQRALHGQRRRGGREEDQRLQGLGVRGRPGLVARRRRDLVRGKARRRERSRSTR